MAKREKFQWTLPRAIFWLQEALKDDERVEVEPYDNGGQFRFASGVHAEIDEKTRELRRFVFDVIPADERVESFCTGGELPWGKCTAEGSPVEPLVWQTELPLPGGTEADKELFQELLRKYLEPQWTDPCSGWYPDVADDLPCDWIDNAMSEVSDMGKMLIGGEDCECNRIYVVRSNVEEKRVRRWLKSVRELPLSEAYQYVNENYPDSYDWPDSCDYGDDDCVPDEPCNRIEDRDIKIALDQLRSDPHWLAVYNGCRRGCKYYVRLLALAAFNPGLVTEYHEDYEHRLAKSVKFFRIADWISLAEASIREGLEKYIDPKVMTAKVDAIKAAERQSQLDAEQARLAAEERKRQDELIWNRYTPEEVIAMFREVLVRCECGELSVEQYDAEVERIGELLDIVCTRGRPGARAAIREYMRDKFPNACKVRGI